MCISFTIIKHWVKGTVLNNTQIPYRRRTIITKLKCERNNTILAQRNLSLFQSFTNIPYTNRHVDWQEQRRVERRDRQRAFSKQLTLTVSRDNVTVDAQKCPKFARHRPCRSLVPAGLYVTVRPKLDRLRRCRSL